MASENSQEAIEAQPKSAEQTAESTTTTEPDPASRTAKLTVQILILCCVGLFIWYVAAERLTPRTDNARVRGYVLPVASSVAGYLVKIPVVNNQVVEKGDVLAQVEQERYRLALQQAEAELELAGQEVGAATSGVASAQAKLVEAAANLNRVKADTRRILKVAEQG